MDTVDKKKEVLQALTDTNDNSLIEEIYELLHPEQTLESIAKSQLPQDLQNKLEQALDDYKSGHYITHDQMKQKLQQWRIK